MWPLPWTSETNTYINKLCSGEGARWCKLKAISPHFSTYLTRPSINQSITSLFSSPSGRYVNLSQWCTSHGMNSSPLGVTAGWAASGQQYYPLFPVALWLFTRQMNTVDVLWYWLLTLHMSFFLFTLQKPKKRSVYIRDRIIEGRVVTSVLQYFILPITFFYADTCIMSGANMFTWRTRHIYYFDVAQAGELLLFFTFLYNS